MKDWFKDLWYEFKTIGTSIYDLVVGILSLLYFLFIKPIKTLHAKIDNFYWKHIASKKRVYEYIRKFIDSGKVKHEQGLDYVISIFEKWGKLTHEQGEELWNLFSEKHPQPRCVFNVPEEVWDCDYDEP